MAVFPSLSGVIGGIETSGRLASQALQEFFGTDVASLEIGVTNKAGSGSLPLKGLAVAKAFRTSPPSRLLIIWHAGLLALLPPLGARKAKVILFLHGVEAWNPLRALPTRLLSRVDCFLTNTEFTWRRFLSLHPQLKDAPHKTVPLGFGDPNSLAPPPQDPPGALMLGRLAKGEDYKGHRQIIEAWPQVIERAPARLVIVGDGDLRPELETLATELNLTRSVTFTGTVTEDEKEHLIQTSRCLALPSKGEGFGIVYVEAMRMGRPCLVSEFDAGKEVVNPPEAGLAVDPDNPVELRDALLRLMSDGQEWTNWSRAAKDRYQRMYTAGHFKERFISALRDYA